MKQIIQVKTSCHIQEEESHMQQTRPKILHLRTIFGALLTPLEVPSRIEFENSGSQNSRRGLKSFRSSLQEDTLIELIQILLKSSGAPGET